MKDLGTQQRFLSIEIESHEEEMFMHQAEYTTYILYQAIMMDWNPMLTRLTQHLENFNYGPFPEPTYFWSLAGSFSISLFTRMNIQFVVNFVCQQMHLLTMIDFSLLKRILRYLKGITTLGLYIKKDPDLMLSTFCDNDWTRCRETIRSTTKFCIMLSSNLISWSAKR